MKGSPLRVRASALSLAIVVLVMLSGAARHDVGLLTEGFVGPRASKDVQVRSTRDSVTFTNADGEWTIFKRCMGTDVAGAGYVARFVSRLGYVVSNDYLEGGFGELNNPEHGGMGTFGVELARGPGPRNWNNTWHLSMRRCGPFGETEWTRPAFGRLPDGTGFYDQDVWLGDAWTPRMLLVRYRWRFDRRGVRLYALVASRCGYCRAELGDPFVKEPKLVVTVNGQASQERFSHMSTFTGFGRWLGQFGECSYFGRNAREETGHCYHRERERVRWDYLDSPQGGCNTTTRVCFNAVLRSYPTHGLRVRVGENPAAWTSPSGLEGWAHDAADEPRPGPDGCVTIDGAAVYRPDQENARNWEYAVFREDDTYRAAMVMAKGWDGCRNSLDATSLYRRLERGSWGYFVSLSLGKGWSSR